MSKIIKETGWREFSSVVETNDGEQYLVSSTGGETMVFEWNKTEDDVDNWMHIWSDHYATYEQMANAHEIICKHLERVIK